MDTLEPTGQMDPHSGDMHTTDVTSAVSEIPSDTLLNEAEEPTRQMSELELGKPEVVILEPSTSTPASYTTNNSKENLILEYAENFRRQFVHLYRDRKPLFINPVNEYGVEKVVCTSIRPTLLPYKELYDWDECARFVSDYLTYKPLDCPNEIPLQLPSSTRVLELQEGNCFDLSMLLCSLLIAAGYDAYCLCGYATREVTLMDQTRDECPLLRQTSVSKEKEQLNTDNKYDVKPPRDLRSKYLLMMEERTRQEQRAEEETLKEAERSRIAELEKPPPDKLYGMRIHCWVLVLAGKREVPENFFIEPSTGICQESMHYLGIETVWNDSNYWVNMQDCSRGIGGMSFDLADIARWEFMFPRSDKPLLLLPGDEDYGMDDDDDDDDDDDVEVPVSWVSEIFLSLADIQRRCPEGKKTILYKKAKHEIFAEYLMPDGMVCRLSMYEDNALTQPLREQEWFKHREDKLEHRERDLVTFKVVERFLAGRRLALREHVYYSNQTGSEATRSMTFDYKARTDGLEVREEGPTTMVEYFRDRDDFLLKRVIEYTKRVKKFGPAEEGHNKPILQITEYYARDDSLKADEDIAELTFSLNEERILIKHHLQKERIVAGTKEFLKPPQNENKGLADLTSDVLTAFQVDRGAKNPKLVHIYTMLIDLLNREESCIETVRQSEQEVQDILDKRTHEELKTELTVSIYDTARNDTAKKRRGEIERKKREEEARREEMELDYLAPFLARLGDPSPITKESALKLKEECLQDLKKRLIDMANLIQGRYEKETLQLKQKQSWYQQNQTTMSKEEEEEYSSSCSEDYFKIQILEQRLNRHKELAPQKYLALEARLRNDPRLAAFLNGCSVTFNVVRTMFRGFDDDPFFKEFNRSFERDYKSMFGAMDRMLGDSRALMDSRHLTDLGFPRLSDLGSVNQLMERGEGSGRGKDDGYSYSHSQVYSYRNDGKGEPQEYQAVSSIAQGPGGIKETRKGYKDSSTKTQRMQYGRHIGDRSALQERLRRGDHQEEKMDYVGFAEEEAPDFDREWGQVAGKLRMPTYAYQPGRLEGKRGKERRAIKY